MFAPSPTCLDCNLYSVSVQTLRQCCTLTATFSLLGQPLARLSLWSCFLTQSRNT